MISFHISLRSTLFPIFPSPTPFLSEPICDIYSDLLFLFSSLPNSHAALLTAILFPAIVLVLTSHQRLPLPPLAYPRGKRSHVVCLFRSITSNVAFTNISLIISPIPSPSVRPFLSFHLISLFVDAMNDTIYLPLSPPSPSLPRLTHFMTTFFLSVSFLLGL